MNLKLTRKKRVKYAYDIDNDLASCLDCTSPAHARPLCDMPAPQGFAAVKRQLLVSDFDESFADADTDRWTFEVLAPHLRRKFEDIGASGSMQFTDMCAMLLRELHAEGVKADEIIAAQKRLYVHPAMVRGVKALRSAASPRTDCFLLSNSNSVYLQSVLEANGLFPPAFDLFNEIVTNPATVESNGLLNLRRRVSPDGPQHDCKVGCSANMCKGAEMDAYLDRHGGRSQYDRLIYLGDGGNDFCPVLRFGKNDVALVRKGYGLERRIREEGGVQCDVRYWRHAWEVEELLDLLRKE